MPSGALNVNTSTRGGGNLRHDPQGNAFAFQHGSLFDVQFNECFVISVWQLDVCEFPSHSSLSADCIDRFTIAVGQFPGSIRRQTPGKQAATEASDSKARRLFRGNNEQLNRVLGMESALLQGSYPLEAGEDANDSIVFPGVRNRVDMRASADDGRFWARTDPAREHISNGVLSHDEPRAFAQLHQPRTRIKVRLREHDSRDPRGICVRERSER